MGVNRHTNIMFCVTCINKCISFLRINALIQKTSPKKFGSKIILNPRNFGYKKFWAQKSQVKDLALKNVSKKNL